MPAKRERPTHHHVLVPVTARVEQARVTVNQEDGPRDAVVLSDIRPIAGAPAIIIPCRGSAPDRHQPKASSKVYSFPSNN